MAHEQQAEAAKTKYQLPVLIFGPVEIHRLQRELEAVGEFLEQMAIRHKGEQQTTMPRTSRLLEAVAANNGLNLLVPEDRASLKAFLDNVDKSAPVIHMSFAADPSAAFTAKIVAWLRSNVHPYALLNLGLQPSIAAGCVVRTANKTFDFSLRQRFSEQRELLISALEGKL